MFVYDAMSRVAGSRVVADGDKWTCPSYDSRGRLLSRRIGVSGGQAERTVTYAYEVGDNPLVRTVSDSAGTITTTVDLLGRVLRYTDARGTVTDFTYDQAGRLTVRSRPRTTERFETRYDDAGRPTDQWGRRPRRPPAHRPRRLRLHHRRAVLGGLRQRHRLASVARDGGRVSGLTWTAAGGGTLGTDFLAWQSGVA